MTDFAAAIESTARGIAADLIAVPGWASDLEWMCQEAHEVAKVAAEHAAGLPVFEGIDVAPLFRAAGERAAAILREVAAEPMALIERYPDLLPAELRALMTAKAIEVLQDAGASVETFKDDEGTTFLRLENVEALRIPADEMERINATAPDPVGALHRVQ